MSTTVVDLLRSATALQALTLHGPWGELVATEGKDVENRTRAPPPACVGGLLAIHQGAQYAPECFTWVREHVGVRKVPSRHQVRRGVVVAVTRLARVVTDSPSPWAMAGHQHWCLEGTVALPEPVACKGAQGLWPVPTEVLHQVREQLLNREGLARAAVALSPTEGPPTGMEKVAAEAWAATRSPTSYYARSSSRGQVVPCPKCGGLYMDYGEGGTPAHAPRLPVGTGPEWPECPHGAALYRDCMGDPCAPPCCQRAQTGGAP